MTIETQVAADLAHVSARERISATEHRMYDAEVALHIAHQTHVDEWIAAAAGRLHDAIEDNRRALAEALHCAAAH